MDKNTVTGFVLIFIILFGWSYLMEPSAAEIEAQKRHLDSLQQIENQRIDSLNEANRIKQDSLNSTTPVVNDSLQQVMAMNQFGGFSPAATGSEEQVVLENDLMRVWFSNKGGKITGVELKGYFIQNTIKEEDGKRRIEQEILKMLEDEKNKFEYLLPVNGKGKVSSEDLYFNIRRNENSITLSAPASNGGSFEQIYTLKEGSYYLDYEVKLNNLNGVLDPSAEQIGLNWENHLDKLEENTQYERNYSSVYYKTSDDSPDYCSCTTSDEEDLGNSKIDWIAQSNQFFTSALFAKNEKFVGGKMESISLDMEDEDLKTLKSQVNIPISGNGNFEMGIFVGPKKFELLQEYGQDFTDIIPFGSGIFGSLNRWLIRPIFNLLSGFIGSAGIVILILTIIVKLAVFPLTYKMIHSQSKMAALKPQLAKLKEKFGDDQQKQQMESMKLYREFGVNPLGGCFPMALQMPIWFALYRFFPASIEFRQASFLWANDLSSYDVAFYLPFEVPFYGEHVSLFTLLWAGATILYSWYNMRHLDMSSMNNPMMKYMQFAMPVMFLFFFNNFASGLTCYLFFSSLFNIGQTLLTKNYLIDHEKIKVELEEYRKKPKKKGGFSARLEQALKEQQKMQAEKEKATKTKRKRK